MRLKGCPDHGGLCQKGNTTTCGRSSYTHVVVVGRHRIMITVGLDCRRVVVVSSTALFIDFGVWVTPPPRHTSPSGRMAADFILAAIHVRCFDGNCQGCKIGIGMRQREGARIARVSVDSDDRPTLTHPPETEREEPVFPRHHEPV